MRAFLLIIVASCIMAGCKKETPNPFAKYYGKWELRETYGGFGGGNNTYAAGNGNIYLFSSNGTYKHYTAGEVDQQGTFQIKDIGANTTAIDFDGGADTETISLTGTKLTIGTTVTDGTASDYEKVGN